MEFTINQKSFDKLIRDVSPAVSRNNRILPILKGIYLEAFGNQIKAVGNDLEISLAASVDAEIKKEGKVVLPFDKLSAIVRKMNDNIKVKVTNNKATVTCGKSRYKISGHPAENFPVLPRVEGVKLEIEGEELSRIVGRVKFAASKADHEPRFQGANFIIGCRELMLVATDTNHSVKDEIAIDQTEQLAIIIPSKALDIIEKFDSGKVKINANNRILCVEGDVSLTSRLIEGAKIPFDRFIPRKCTGRAIVNRIDFLNATQRCSVFTTIKESVVYLGYANNEVIIESKELEEGKAVEILDAEVELEAEAFYDVKKLIPALKVMDCENIVLENDENVLMITPDEVNSGFIYILGVVRGQRREEKADDSTGSD